jgi:hypothetical protein
MFEQLFNELGAAGLPGLLVALVVLVGVFLARRGGIVVSGDQARIANLMIAVIASGLDPLNVQADDALVAVIGSIVSALLFEGIKLIGDKMPSKEPAVLG